MILMGIILYSDTCSAIVTVVGLKCPESTGGKNGDYNYLKFGKVY